MPKRPPRIDREIRVPADLQKLEAGTAVWTSKRGELRMSDALELLGSLDAGSVDLVVADPPYAISKDEWDQFESIDVYVDWCDQWLAEVERVLAPSGSAYVCGFSEILADVKARSARRFDGGCRWLVWYYRNKANLGSDWGRSHESVLHLRKRRKVKLNVDEVRIPYNAHTKKYPERVQAVTSQYGGKSKRRDRWTPHPLGAKPRDVFEIPVLCNGMGERTLHPTQKPEELIRRFIAGTTEEGGLVVDPFVGSGTTAVVAERLGRRWLAGDLEPGYLAMARERLVAELGADSASESA